MFNYLNQSTSIPAVSPTMSYDWVNLRKASRAQYNLHEQHGPNGAASGWPAVGARYCGKIVTGIQGGKLSTAKKIVKFLQAPVASLWTLFSFLIGKVRVLALLVFFVSLQPVFTDHCGTLTSLSNMHWSIHYSIYFNSSIHTFLCIIPSGGFAYCTGLPSFASYNKCVPSSDNIEGK